MNLLAIDTSSLACSVALSLGGDISERHTEQAREHTKLLVPMIEALLSDGGVSLEDIDAFVLGNGPGSFIGMRISASLVQGLAFGVSRPVVPVSSLLAVAEAVFDERDCDEVIVAQDAHMNEVYIGRYVRAPDGAITPRVDECIHDQAKIAGLRDDIERVAAGAGWRQYPDLLAANKSVLSEVSPQMHPAARYLLPSALKSLEQGAAIDPADISPSYLRHKVATPPARS